MAELKTKETDEDVMVFLERAAEGVRREDCLTVLQLMREVTGEEPRMWGSSIIGFGRYWYSHRDGERKEWFVTGFSPRKQDLTLYVMTGFDQSQEILSRLGKYKTGKACLYLKKLKDVDPIVLRELVEKSVASMSERRV